MSKWNNPGDYIEIKVWGREKKGPFRPLRDTLPGCVFAEGLNSPHPQVNIVTGSDGYSITAKTVISDDGRVTLSNSRKVSFDRTLVHWTLVAERGNLPGIQVFCAANPKFSADKIVGILREAGLASVRANGASAPVASSATLKDQIAKFTTMLQDLQALGAEILAGQTGQTAGVPVPFPEAPVQAGVGQPRPKIQRLSRVRAWIQRRAKDFTIRDVADALGVSKNNAAADLLQMFKRGEVLRRPEKVNNLWCYYRPHPVVDAAQAVYS